MADEPEMIDVSDCNEMSVNVTIYQHENAESDPQTWPTAVREIVARHYREWRAHNPDIDVVARTAELVLPQRVCVMTYFHRPKVPA